MTAIALVIFTGFVLYVMVWSIKNGNARSIKDQTGIIKMRDPSGPSKPGSSSAPQQATGDVPARAGARRRRP